MKIELGSKNGIHALLACSALALASALPTTFAQTSCVPQPKGLVGWWRGEGNTTDSASTNNGTIVNGVSYVPGEVGQGFAFTAVSSGVNLGNPTNLQLQNFTLEAWIKRGSSTQCSWDVFGIAHVLGAAWGGYGMGMNDAGRIFLTKIGYSNVYSTNTVTDTNSFHHIVVTKSGSTVVFYIDGQSETAAAYDPGFVFNGTFAIGARGSDYNSTFRGAVDEASIYNRPLTSAEVQSLYQAGSAGKCVTQAPQTCTPAPSGLVAWWRGEGNANDSENGNNGTFTNPQYANGEVGKAFSFDGSGNNVRVPASASLDVGSGAGLTVEGWINSTDNTYGRPIAEWVSPTVGGYAVHMYIHQGFPGTLYANLVDTTGNYHMILSPAGLVQTNVEQHVAVTYDKASGVGRLYVNGAIVQESSLGTFTPQTSPDLSIGYRPSTVPFGPIPFFGQIDELSIYSRALNPNELAAIYQAGAAGKCITSQNCVPAPAGLVAWWRGEGNANDSENGNNGMFTNAQYAAGEVGTAFSFDGSGNNVRVPASPTMDVGAGPGMTIESWIYSTDTSYARPIVEWVPNTVGAFAAHFYAHQHGPGVLYANLVDTSGNYHMIETPPGLVPTNVYAHVAVTYDKSSGIARLFVNGTLETEANLGTFTPLTSPDLSIGYRPNTVPFGPIPFYGSIDEVSLYSRALAPSEIQAIYSAGSAGKCHSTTTCAPVPSGLVSWWKGDGNASDTTGGNNGTLENGTGFAPGEVQQAFVFNGTDQYVEIPDSPSLNPTNALSLETWVYVSGNPQTDAAAIIYKFSPTDGALNQYQLVTHLVNGVLYFRPVIVVPSGYAALDGKTAIAFNTWYHVAMTYDGAALNLYVNGALDGTVAASGPVLAKPVPLLIGGPSSGPWWFNGRVDEVSLYSRALSGAEVQAIYNAGTAGKCFTTTAPFIVSQPTNQTVVVGVSATFNVVANGTGPLSYQWFFGTKALEQGTNATLTLNNVQFSDAGAYSVIISNSAGSVASSTATLSVTSGTCVAPPAGLISWWKGDGNTLDSVGGNHGVLLNGTNYATGEVQQAFTFNGVDQYVQIPDAPSLNPTNALSLETWVYVSGNPQTDAAAIIYKFSPTDAQLNQYQLVTHLVNGKLFFRPVLLLPSGYAALDGKTTITFNTWYHVAMTYDGSALNLYVNGALDGSVAASGPVVAKPVPLLIGGPSAGPWWFNGRVDEVSLYDRALSASEVQAIYNAGASGKCPTAIAPSFEVEPQSQTATVGSTVTLAPVVAGSLPMNFTWFFGNNALTGQTNSSLTLSNISQANQGQYSLLAMNSAGAATSSVAVLTVTLPAASIQMATPSLAEDGTVTVPVLLAANGNENAAGFSINFDPMLLTYQGTVLGGGASNGTLLVNSSQATSGKLGIALAMPAGITFGAGTQQLAVVTFSSAVVSSNTTTSLTFGDSPIKRQLTDASGASLAATFIPSTQLTLPITPVEGDVYPRPDGDQSLSINDWVLVGRYVAALDSPTNSSEFQRADCAPRETLGDGALTVSDWVQAGRYAAGLDPAVRAGGPTSPVPAVVVGPAISAINRKGQSNPRQLSIMASALNQAQSGTVQVALQAQGDENALAFSLSFDPSRLVFSGATVGGSAVGATLNINANRAAQGQLGLALALSPGQTFPAAAEQVVNVSFRPVAPLSGTTSISFADQPVLRGVADANATLLPTDYLNGALVVNPPPSLKIVTSSTSVTLSWPAAATGFVLQESADASTTGWSQSSATPVVANNEAAVSIPLSSTKRFYRLYHP